jgi:hypothetical protein
LNANDTLLAHASELSQQTGLVWEVIQERGHFCVVCRGWRLPDGICKLSSTDILFIADAQYPLSSMDMFWTEVEVVRPDGSIFEGSDCIEEHLGRKWRRFSYHRNGIWNPAGNPLADHFAFMESRWSGRAL